MRISSLGIGSALIAKSLPLATTASTSGWGSPAAASTLDITSLLVRIGFQKPLSR